MQEPARLVNVLNKQRPLKMGNEQKANYSESGITNVHTNNRMLGDKQAFYREIALTTLKLENGCSKAPSLYCFDAVAENGMSGLQWKKYLGDKVTVMCGDNNNDGSIQKQCEVNNIIAKDWNQVGNSEKNITPVQGSDQIYISTLPTKVLLHSEAFDFVYLHSQPNHGVYMYIESLVSTIKGGGIACLLCPNIASQCFRSPKLIQRQYYAHTRKTVYVTEMAARIIIGDIVRSAGRHGRVADILCTLSAEGLFLFIIRIRTSYKKAGEAVDKCRPILHCLMCEERVVYPETHCPVEMPYQLLPCDCNSQNPGKTATILGPMWVGPMYDVPFIEKLADRLKTEFPNSAGNNLLNTVITEAICDNKLTSTGISGKTLNPSAHSSSSEPPLKRPKLDSQSKKIENQIGGGDMQYTKIDNITDNLESKSDSMKDNQNECLESQSHNPEKQSEKLENISDNLGNQAEVPSKEDVIGESHEGTGQSTLSASISTAEALSDRREPMPLFYYHLHQLRCTVVPRSDVVITRLKKSGYRASRTHFEPYSIRTNATQKQLKAIIEQMNKQS